MRRAWRNDDAVVGRRLSPNALRINFLFSTLDHRLMNALFDVLGTIPNSPQPLVIGFVLGKESLGRPLTRQPVVTQLRMLHMHETDAFCARLPCSRLDDGPHSPAVRIAPRPR